MLCLPRKVTLMPAGGGPQPSKAFRASNPMSLHYSGQKMLRSAQVKNAMVKRFMQLFRLKRSELALSENNLLRTDAWGWEEFAALNQSGQLQAFDVGDAVQPSQAAETLVVVDEDALIEVEPPQQPCEVDDAEAEPAEEDDWSGSGITSPSDSSPSASDHTADGEDLLAVMPEESVGMSLPWFVQGARTHIMKSTDETHQLVPWCRDRPFAQECKKRGEGFSLVAKQQICQWCLARMPRSIYAALAEHCSWQHWLVRSYENECGWVVKQEDNQAGSSINRGGDEEATFNCSQCFRTFEQAGDCVPFPSMAYGRCRNSDLVHVSDVMHDTAGGSALSGSSGYMQVTTRHHKFARSAAAKSWLLPIVVSGEGVGAVPWLDVWIVCRKQAGLPVSGTIEGALLPAPVGSGWAPVTCSETGDLLRMLLAVDDGSVSSHSLKSTCLSWAAKAGMPIESRRLLGRHADAVQSADSRDLTIGPLRELQCVIRWVREGLFHPDNNRAEYFPSGHPTASASTPGLNFQPKTPAFIQPVLAQKVSEPMVQRWWMRWWWWGSGGWIFWTIWRFILCWSGTACLGKTLQIQDHSYSPQPGAIQIWLEVWEQRVDAEQVHSLWSQCFKVLWALFENYRLDG